jgi:amidase
MARTVADAAALLGVIAGPDPKDPTTLPDPVGDYLADIGRGIEGIRIGVDPDVLATITDTELSTAIGAAIETLRALGARVREVHYPPPEEYLRIYFAETASEVGLAHAGFFPAHADRYGKALRGIIEAGGSVKGQDVVRVQHERMRFCGALSALFAEIEILLLPLLPHATQTVAEMAQMSDPGEFIIKRGRYSLPFNASGSPAMVVPCGFDRNGMLLAMQLVGRHLDENLLFRAGHAYQRVTDWHTRHPSLD